MKILWLLIHHLIAHPLMIFNTEWADEFHDYTAKKAFCVHKKELEISKTFDPPPFISDGKVPKNISDKWKSY